MQIKNQRLIPLTVGVLALSFSIGYLVFAWTEPTQSPPNGNVPGPINISTTTQTKLGGLNIATYSGNVGIGTTNPSQKLTVAGNIGIQTTSNAFIGTLNNYALSLRTNNTDRIFITNAGDVAIGATNPAGYKLYVNGNVAVASGYGYYYASDITKKTNIQPLTNSLEKILQLQGVSFIWKDTKEPSIGLIAQEVEKVFPQVVSTNSDGLKWIDYSKLTVPLIEAIKEQQKEIELLKAKIQELELKCK